MNVLVVTPLFALSGVPLAQVRLARALARRDFTVHLVIGHISPGVTLEPIEGVTTEVLGTKNVRSMLRPLVRILRKTRPDIVFSAEDHLNVTVILAARLAGVRTKITGSSRVTPFDTYSDKPFSKRWFLKWGSRLTMSRAGALTCVSEDMVEQYRQVFRHAPHVCVYNIVDDATSRERLREPVDHPWLTDKTLPVLVAAGRLAEWKGFTYLIEAVALLRRECAVRLLILGDGPLRHDLQAQIDALRLSDCIELVGYVSNPLKYFSRADVFVLSSLVEGLPNVLVEAMMCGCTPVATDCPTGPREVLQNGRYGYLVPVKDPAAMARAMAQALSRPIASELLQQAVAPFAETAVINRHLSLLGVTT